MASATKKTTRHQDAGSVALGSELDSSMFWFGDLNAWGAFPTAPTIYQKPRPQVFYVARNWYDRQCFLKGMGQLKFDIFNFGFKVQAAGPVPGEVWSKTKAKDWQERNARVQKWFKDNEIAVLNFVRDAWQEWLIQDNAVALWCPDCPPVIYPVEHVTYRDDMGIEELSFAHGMSAAEIDSLRNVSSTERQAMKNTKDVLLRKQGSVQASKLYKYQVLKRARVGAGLAWPAIRTLFSTAATFESLEHADWQLADALRTVYEMHLIGHEIKNGQRAGFPDNFLKPKRAAAVNKIIGNNKKLMASIKRLVVNFDHKIEYPRPDPKHFGKERYEAALERMMYMAMPIAQMLFAKQMNPWHGLFLQAKARTERDYLGPFIKLVLKEALKAPSDITVSWGEEIFMDPRLMLDVLKTGLINGPISQESFLEKTNVTSAHVERSRKDGENELPPHIARPVWDAAHGVNPSDPNAGAPGRPGGAQDKAKRAGKK